MHHHCFETEPPILFKPSIFILLFVIRRSSFSLLYIMRLVHDICWCKPNTWGLTYIIFLVGVQNWEVTSEWIGDVSFRCIELSPPLYVMSHKMFYKQAYLKTLTTINQSMWNDIRTDQIWEMTIHMTILKINWINFMRGRIELALRDMQWNPGWYRRILMRLVTGFYFTTSKSYHV